VAAAAKAGQPPPAVAEMLRVGSSFYLGIAHEQDGDLESARKLFAAAAISGLDLEDLHAAGGRSPGLSVQLWVTAAAYRLGRLWLRRVGGPTGRRNRLEAAHWLAVAAARGHEPAELLLVHWNLGHGMYRSAWDHSGTTGADRVGQEMVSSRLLALGFDQGQLGALSLVTQQWNIQTVHDCMIEHNSKLGAAWQHFHHFSDGGAQFRRWFHSFLRCAVPPVPPEARGSQARAVAASRAADILAAIAEGVRQEADAK